MERSLRILHLEDSPRDAELVCDVLESEGLTVEITHAADRARYLESLERATFDVILCDHNIPGYDGFSALRHAREKHPDVPVLIVSGSIGEEEAVRCLQAGAADYLLKDRLQRLGPAVNRAVEHAEAVRREGKTEQARRELEEQFRQAQKMEAIGRLAGGIAHDFNNLLTAIIGYSELVLDRVRHDADLAADIQEIKTAGERASRLTGQLLAFSRKQAVAPRVLDLNQIVSDVEKMLKRVIGEDVALEMAPAVRVGRVKIDPGQVEQVLMNLAVNARDAMPSGGTLRISTADAVLDAMFAQEHAGAVPGRYVSLAVRDTGVGMKPDVVARVFEPFFTTKPIGKGTGLGLSTVYGIVKQNNGYVTVDSAPGAGTTFTIYWPEVDEPADASPLARAPLRTMNGDETVLLVDDEPGVRELVKKMLERHGYRVLSAKDGLDALAIEGRHDGPIDLLLTDVVMPGLNGPDLAQRLVRRRPAMPVLYMSGFAHQAVMGVGSISTRTDFLQKPFASETLGLKVRECLDRHARQRNGESVRR